MYFTLTATSKVKGIQLGNFIFHMHTCVLSHFSRVQLFVTLWTCSLPGSSVPGILHAQTLEWVGISSCRGSSWPRDQTWVFCIAGGFFTTESPGKPILHIPSARFWYLAQRQFNIYPFSPGYGKYGTFLILQVRYFSSFFLTLKIFALKYTML